MSALKSEFASRNSWFTRVTAGTAAIALSMLGVSFQASAEPPPKDSPQWKILSPFGGFIKGAKNSYGGGCCDVSDGRAGAEELPVTSDNLDRAREVCGNEAKPGDYCVKVTEELYGEGVPAEGKWVHVPQEKVLKVQQWTKDPDGAGPEVSQKAACEASAKEKKAAGDKVPATYCDQPPINILWYAKYSNNTYCYWPKPRF